jgi:hypothetical protein
VTFDTYTRADASVLELVELVLVLVVELLLVELVLELLLPEPAAQANGTTRTSRKIHKIPSFVFIKFSGKSWAKQPVRHVVCMSGNPVLHA